MATSPSLLVKVPNQILDDMIRTIKSGLIDIGIIDPQVDPGSDYYIMAQAVANELAVAEQNVMLQADALMPDTARGSDLDRILSNYGLSRRSASTGVGACQLVSTASTVVPLNAQLVSSTGLVYQVIIGGTYANLAEIPIQSVSTGEAVNLAIGEVLNWVSTPAFAQSTSIVTQAVTGAVDAETDDVARQRLLSRMQNPPALGNWQQVADMCESFDPAVQKSFIYPVANGPSTLHVALTGYATATSKSRALASSKVTSLTSSIQGQLPEYVDSFVSTVTDVPVDISFKLTLPYPLGAVNLGTGGGWVDFQPFPAATVAQTYYTASVTNSTSFVMLVPAQNPAPIPGITHISWIDRTNNYTVRTATILTAAYANFFGVKTYIITIDTPFVGMVNGDYIFPSCINAQTYVNNILAHFALMGPGEKTDIATLLPRAYRKPRPNLSFPNAVDGSMLRAVIESGTEVLSADYWYSTYGTTAPALPSLIELPPNIYIPRQIGLYPASIA
jgi:uncharacterized phage protein gp47/JayE